eukprot:Hpha_TRINITY_DN16767_c0_g3::TRINITY_DN16767_c0_g3_i1::g.76719::m.76719
MAVARIPQHTPFDLPRGTDFVVASLLGGMEYDGNREDGWEGRFLRVGVLFFVLIITATYTANLASILTAQKVVLHGPRSMGQLKTSNVCNFDRLPVRMAIGDHARIVTTPNGSAPVWEATELGRRQCVEMLLKGEVEAVIANVLELRQMQRDFGHCNDVQVIPQHVSFNPRYVTFMATVQNAALVQHITESIVALQSNKLLVSMMDENYGGFCTEDAEEPTVQVKFQHLSGLFVILGCFVGVALLLRLVRLIWEASKGGKRKG